MAVKNSQLVSKEAMALEARNASASCFFTRPSKAPAKARGALSTAWARKAVSTKGWPPV